MSFRSNQEKVDNEIEDINLFHKTKIILETNPKTALESLTYIQGICNKGKSKRSTHHKKLLQVAQGA